jgi:hypothetical protein
MSTHDTAALVESVNKMTEAVAGKIGEIDKKVDDAVSVIPNLLLLTLYVDAERGSDEGDGSSLLPYKTIKKAVESAPPICRLKVVLRGSSADNRHLIDETIIVGSRVVSITYGYQHIVLADDLVTVFICFQLGVVEFNDSVIGSGKIYSSGVNKVLVVAKGKAALHIGGYYSLVFCSDDNTSLTLMKSAYRESPRGFCEITLSRFYFRALDGVLPANSVFRSFVADEAGSALYHVWQSQLGNGVDESNAQSVTLVGSAKLISS